MKRLLTLLLFPTALFAGITLQSISPTRPEPGDLISLRFAVDTPGTGGVWIDGTRRCIAERYNFQVEGNRYICQLVVPFGGSVPMQIRFTSEAGEQTFDTGIFASSIAIVKAQPEQPELGRSALFFVRLGIDVSASQPLPTGTISIRQSGGAEICSLVLPAQTFCQAIMNISGRNEYIARYSGDSSYPALESAAFAVLTKKPGLTTTTYVNEGPMTPSVGGFSYLSRPSPNGRMGVGPYGQISSADVGASFNLFYQPWFGFRSWDTDYSIHVDTNDYVSVLTPRGEIYVGESANVVHIYPDRSRLVQTSSALVANDTNAADDLYVLDPANSTTGNLPAPRWVSAKPDGSAALGGVRFLEMIGDSRVFKANQPGFFAAGTSASDFLIDSPGLALRRVPAVYSQFVELHALSADGNFALLSSFVALNNDDTNARNDAYRYTFAAQTFARITSDEDSSLISLHAAIAPDNSVVVVLPDEQESTSQVIWYRNGDSLRRYDSGDFGDQINVDTRFVLSGAGTARQQLNLISGAQRIDFPERLGDERLVTGRGIAISADGSTIASSPRIRIMKGGARTTLAEAGALANVLSLDANGNRLLLSTVEALMVEDTNTRTDIYAWRAQTGSYELLSRTPAGTRPIEGVLQNHGVSEADGIMFYSLSAADSGVIGANQVVRLALATQNVQILPAPEATGCLPGTFTETRWILWRCRTGVTETFYRGDGVTGQTLRLDLPQGVRPQTFAPNGDKFVFARTISGVLQAALYDLASGNIRELGLGSSARISLDGRFALVAQSSTRSDDGGVFSYSFISGLTAVELASSLQSSYRILPSFNYLLSANGCQFVSIGNFIDSGLQTRVNPLCKEPSYVGIVRTSPTPLTYADTTKIDVVVNHKSTGAAPTGIVRVTGAGGQCDAALTPQGTAAFGRCELKLGRDALKQFEQQPSFKAEYFGDATYAVSESVELISIALRPLSVAFEVDPAAQFAPGIIRARARILNASASQPFRGTILFRNGMQTICALSALEIAQNLYCEFYANSTVIQPFVQDLNYQGNFAIFLQRDEIFRAGFEF